MTDRDDKVLRHSTCRAPQYKYNGYPIPKKIDQTSQYGKTDSDQRIVDITDKFGDVGVINMNRPILLIPSNFSCSRRLKHQCLADGLRS